MSLVENSYSGAPYFASMTTLRLVHPGRICRSGGDGG